MCHKQGDRRCLPQPKLLTLAKWTSRLAIRIRASPKKR
jgi:hypothetical protein